MNSLERRMREAEVGSQSADTIKLSFRSHLFPDSDRSIETAPARGAS
jgi:hypothetical protein